MRRPRSLLLASLCLLAQLGAPERLLAQPSAVSVTAAEALFEDGRRAMAEGNLELACSRFRESNRLDPAAGTLLNLADCEERRGLLATAWSLFKNAVGQLDSSDDRLTVARSRLASLDARVPKLVLELEPGASKDTRASVAGIELGQAGFGVQLPLDPGDYDVVVTAPRHENRVISVKLSQRRVTRLRVAPGASLDAPAPAPEPAPAPVQSTDQGSRRTWTYVLGGVGIAGLGAGTIAGLMTLKQKSIADANCNEDRHVCSAEGKQANDSGRTYGMFSTAGFAVGVLGIGGATYLLLTAPDEPESAALGATFGSDRAGMSFEKHF
jgi:hypothetical protein